MTKYFVTPQGVYIGGYDGADPPESSIEVPIAPANAADLWVNGGWQVATPPLAPRHITTLAFRNRFSQAEKVAIEMAALDDPAAAMPARLQAAAIRVNLADTAAARYIDLDRPDTRQGVQDMETDGLLAAGRAAAILDAPVLDIERAAV